MTHDELQEAVEASNLPDDAKAALRLRLTPSLVPEVIDPEIAARILEADISDDGKSALRSIASGLPPWVAIQSFGVVDVAETWRAAESVGLLQTDTPSLLDRKARIVTLADSQIEARLLDPAEKPSLVELNLVGGTASDKLFRVGRTTSTADQVQKLIERLHARGGGKASVTTTVELEPDAIDVEAEEESGS